MYQAIKNYPQAFLWKVENGNERELDQCERLCNFLNSPVGAQDLKKVAAVRRHATPNAPKRNVDGWTWQDIFTQHVRSEFYRLFPEDIFQVLPYADPHVS